ncbi:hypothetical protein L596_009973 [Steinernema carpocapsae]|uniref:Uncharacterized protein n=1 Tax=Steinernema carpocapsae TaxID=34508 RepID=A0A4U5PH73_STECR|nr:hypothetical protein L596_009973 [Steinernema carpocapsae]
MILEATTSLPLSRRSSLRRISTSAAPVTCTSSRRCRRRTHCLTSATLDPRRRFRRFPRRHAPRSDQTMIVEPAAVRPATPAVAPIPEEEPCEPVVLDIDDAWLGIPLDPVRSTAKDCGEVKRLKDLTGHQILRELYTDIKSVGAELDREMKALKQSGEGVAKAVEDLDPKVIGKKIHALCEHDRFYVQHDWFNMVAAANETHLEQLREKLAEVERANEEVRKKQALVSKLPELEKRVPEIMKYERLKQIMAQRDVQKIAQDMTDAPELEHKASVKRVQLIKQKTEYWRQIRKNMEKMEQDHQDLMQRCQKKLQEAKAESDETDAKIASVEAEVNGL